MCHFRQGISIGRRNKITVWCGFIQFDPPLVVFSFSIQAYKLYSYNGGGIS
jgi:hypothetical protein